MIERQDRGAVCGERRARRASARAAAARRVRGYRDLGAAFGMAFQIYDDVLGIWADTQATGKIAGADIVRRKKTFPIVWALQGSRERRERALIAQAYAGTG